MLEDVDNSVVKAALALLRNQVSYASEPLRRSVGTIMDEKILSKGKRKANEILATESALVDISNIGLIIEALKTIQSLG
jgi:hypothetical protein